MSIHIPTLPSRDRRIICIYHQLPLLIAFHFTTRDTLLGVVVGLHCEHHCSVAWQPLAPGSPNVGANGVPHSHRLFRTSTALAGLEGHSEHHRADFTPLATGSAKDGLCLPHSHRLFHTSTALMGLKGHCEHH